MVRSTWALSQDASWAILGDMSVTLFTKETARAAALRSHEVRLANKRAAALRKAELEREILAAALKPLPADQYVAQRLARVRAQLDRLDTMLLEELDPQRLDRLAAASARLSEIERQLAGRPGPGQFRPTAPRRRVDETVIVPE